MLLCFFFTVATVAGEIKATPDDRNVLLLSAGVTGLPLLNVPLTMHVLLPFFPFFPGGCDAVCLATSWWQMERQEDRFLVSESLFSLFSLRADLQTADN